MVQEQWLQLKGKFLWGSQLGGLTFGTMGVTNIWWRGVYSRGNFSKWGRGRVSSFYLERGLITAHPLVRKTLEYNYKRLGHILPQSEAQEFNQDVINLLHLKTKPEYEKKTLNTKIFPKKDEFYSLLPALIILITLILPIIAYYNLHLLWHKIKKTKTKLILFT